MTRLLHPHHLFASGVLQLFWVDIQKMYLHVNISKHSENQILWCNITRVYLRTKA